MTRGERLTPRAALTLAAAFALFGCAGAAKPLASKGPPASPAAARVELNQLEREILRNRVALGLGPRRDGDEADKEEQPKDAGQAFAPAKPRPAPPPSDDADRAPACEARTASSGWKRREEDCPLPCRQTRAICHAARRICSIADYLADVDSRKRCAKARKDCEKARESTRSKCSDCPAKKP